MNFSPELDLVVAAMRARFNPGADRTPAAPSSETVTAAMHIAVRNKLLLLLREPLQPMLTDEQSSYIDVYRFQTMQMNSTIMRESAALSKALLEHNVGFIFIKGPIQQKYIYDDFFSRPCSDIDILAKSSDYSKIYDVISSIGYQTTSSSLWWRVFLGEQHLTKSGPPPVTVDLHYRIQQPGSPAPRSTQSYLARPDRTSVLGMPLEHLAAEDIPVLSAISIVKGLFNRESVGAHVADLYACVTPDVPQQLNTFLTIAAAQNLRGTALLALRIVSEVFGVKYHLAEEIGAMLPAVSGPDLVRMALTPTDPNLVWPKRREVLWHLCLKRPGRYAREIARAMASEAALRLFERPETPAKP
ncbi:nucleotidyltransferase family protein [Devosia sp. SL43]|uniref:nucleotidyltransferase family protein n=1 Tax=Devosia sp. SL43 TaxID=2806348 RepID=UPI001F18B38F|nr:nucleotidyltransferase family protein [Devosia sp. SL43]UJW87449.1 nucleotidyltransferase family protein [Devosia sp. SL43]